MMPSSDVIGPALLGVLGVGVPAGCHQVTITIRAGEDIHLVVHQFVSTPASLAMGELKDSITGYRLVSDDQPLPAKSTQETE